MHKMPNLVEIELRITVNSMKMKVKSPPENNFPGATIWREYVGIEPTREVPSPPHRF